MEKQMRLIDTAVNEARPPQSGDPDLIARIRAAVKATDLSQVAVSKQIGLSASVLSQWLSGTYPGDIASVEVKARSWLNAQAERAEVAAALPDRPVWFAGPTAQKIFSTLAYAQTMSDLVAIYGGPGLGKTVTLSHYGKSHPSVWIATMAPDCKGVVPCLEEVAEAVGIRELPNGARKIARLIRRRIKGTGGLLIIDEAQHLSLEALEELRSIQDATTVGMALVGNQTVYNRLTGGARTASFAQLFSRIGLALPLTRPSTGDVRAMADAWRVEGAAEIALLEKIAAKPGALRAVTKVLVLASVGAAGNPIDTKRLEQARRRLGH